MNLSQTTSITIPMDLQNQRIDQVLAYLHPQYSRSRFKQWIEQGYVLLNQQTIRAKTKVKANDTITILPISLPEQTCQPQAIPLQIVYQDDSLLLINKPAGLVVHQGAGHLQGTLQNALLHYHHPLKHLPRAGIVHRLDKDTSGLLVIAKTLTTYHYLVEQLQKRRIVREYQAVVTGILTAGNTINAAIGRHAIDRKRMAVRNGGKPAITHYRIIEKFRGHTHIKVKLETGRTHQIRVHMAYINHALVGDKTYHAGIKLPKQATAGLIQQLQQFPRQALHAYHLGLYHPKQGNWLEWTIKLPQDLTDLLEQLKHDHQQSQLASCQPC